MGMNRKFARVISRLERSFAKRIPDKQAATVIKLAVGPQGPPEQTVSAARRLEARGEGSQAIGLLRQAIAHRGNDADLTYQLGFLLERHNDYASALDAYTSSLESAPSAQVLYRRGRCHQALGDDAKASADFAHSLRFDDQDFRVHQALLEVSSTEPLWRRREILENGLAAPDVDAEWRAKLASAEYSMGHFLEAANHYALLDTDSPKDHFGLRYVECLYLAGHKRQARQAFRERATTLTSRERASSGLGGYLQSLGRWHDAAHEYSRELGTASTPHELHRGGYAYMRAYSLKSALPLLARASRTQADNPAWVFHEAMCLEKLRRLEEGIEAYLWAYEMSGSSYHLYRAVSCARDLGNPQYMELVAEHLHEKVVGDLADAVEPSHDTSLTSRQRTAQAWKRGARDALQEIAQRMRREGRLDEALKLLSWLCDTEDTLNPVNHTELAAVYLQRGDIPAAFDAYLESRPLRTAHGLDERHLPPTLDRTHAVYLEFCESRPVDDRKVLYESNHGTALTCNVLPMLRRNLDTQRGREQLHVVVINDPQTVPSWAQGRENVVFVRRGGHAYLKHLATARWLINNNTFPPYFSRRREQSYLNTWHGTPLKALGRDIRSGMMDHRNAARNFLHATHLAMPNIHTAEVLVDRYDVSGLYGGKLAITGFPRIDNTVSLDSDREQELRAMMPNKPVVLYAPTWRGTLGDKEFDTERLVDDLAHLSELPVHLIFKPHPLTEELLRDVDIPAHTAPANVDINELLAVTDILITDYSSIFFDYYPLNRPVILYAYDEDEYFRDRGAYFDMDDLPGVVCRTLNSVTSTITDILDHGGALTPGALDVEAFCALDDGTATDRVLAFFFDGDDQHEIDSSFSKGSKEEILFFSGSFIPNGITSSFEGLATKLIESSRYNLSVVCQPEAVYSDPNRLDNFHQLPGAMRAFGRLGSMASLAEEQWLIDRFHSLHEFFSPEHRRIVLKAFRREFRRLFGDAKFDHVVCFEGYARFWAVLFASVDGASTSRHVYLHSDMVHERDSRFRYLDGIFALYDQFDSLISVSSSVNEVNRHKLAPLLGLEEDRLVSARNMINPDDIRVRAQDGPQLTFPWDEGVKVFVTTGRLTPEKGHGLLLEAFANVAQDRDDAALVVIGDGPLMVQLKGFVAAQGLSRRVLFPGYMENPLGVVAQADCFIFPSRYEGQGLSLVEALVLGLPAIGTDVVGVRSVLENGEGLLVDLSVSGIEAGIRAFLDGEPMGRGGFEAGQYVAAAMAEFESAVSRHSRNGQR